MSPFSFYTFCFANCGDYEMECKLPLFGVCGTSFRDIAPNCAERAFGKPSNAFSARRLQGLRWKLSKGSGIARNRVDCSLRTIANRKPLRKQVESCRFPEKVGGRSMSLANSTTDEALPSRDDEPVTSDNLPEQAVLSQHPWDPHKPSFSKLLPESVRPYPSFEGWFVRMWDPQSTFSAAVIMATNYATKESQVTLLFNPAQEDLGTPNAGAVRREENGMYVLRTYAVAELSEDATFVDLPSNNVSKGHKPLNSEPVGFEWKAPGLGLIKATADETQIDVTIKGYSLQARLSNNLPWDADQSERGPEGWAGGLPLLTNWYVYSLGSTVEFKFSGPDGVLARNGTGWAHQEKNWGITFPAGHVWFQGFSADNSAQILGSAAYFKAGESVRTPYLVVLGYRSPKICIDMRTIDPGTVSKNISISPLTGEFSVEGISESHSIYIKARADPNSFSEAILAPIGKTHWEPACRETYLAEVDVEVYEHAIWGIIGKDKLVDKRTFTCAGLEFGEDLMQQATQKAAQTDRDEQIERS